MNKTIVIIPTYDEKDNVSPLSRSILQAEPGVNILFVDDNSPDGTGRIIDQLCGGDRRINVIHRPGKTGLGNAYVAGFRWALERDYKYIIGMDADFSHDPCEIPNFVKALEQVDFVVGSRYINGIRIINWPFSRLLLSKSASMYVRIITGIPVADPTSGYRGYRREVLEKHDFGSVMSSGYSFLVEMAHTAWMQGFSLREIPIIFKERVTGYSKISMPVFMESVMMVWKLLFRCGLRRSPKGKHEIRISEFETNSPPRAEPLDAEKSNE